MKYPTYTGRNLVRDGYNIVEKKKKGCEQINQGLVEDESVGDSMHEVDFDDHRTH